MADWKRIRSTRLMQKQAPFDGRAYLVTNAEPTEELEGHNTYVAAWWPEAGENGTGDWICYMSMTLEPSCPIEPTHYKEMGLPPGAAADVDPKAPGTPPEGLTFLPPIDDVEVNSLVAQLRAGVRDEHVLRAAAETIRRLWFEARIAEERVTVYSDVVDRLVATRGQENGDG